MVIIIRLIALLAFGCAVYSLWHMPFALAFYVICCALIYVGATVRQGREGEGDSE